ncbi:MAG: regulatory protein ArsR [Acidobacteria bacterium OLB17]|nr:MAG: regulatory protein ArsR [Acidobacteria bacterium OLB17]MCZ2391589.1 metalloregulator ArsR/SmtB family transcription factor [Acidobacteriota bacterium]
MGRKKNWKKPPEALALVATRFKVLSEPLRLRILQELETGALSVGELTTAVGATQPNVSKHLKMLQDAGIVARKQEGNTAFYSIADESVFALCDLVCGSLKEKFTERSAMFG